MVAFMLFAPIKVGLKSAPLFKAYDFSTHDMRDPSFSCLNECC